MPRKLLIGAVTAVAIVAVVGYALYAGNTAPAVAPVSATAAGTEADDRAAAPGRRVL